MNVLKRFLQALFITLFWGAVMAPSLRAASRAEALFQEAVLKESGEHDPEGAVPLYQEAIDAAGTDHRLISKARLRMGNCLERVGKPKEAEEIYLEIIHESTASLLEAVQAAQANLERLQAQEKKAKEEAAKSKPMVLVHEFHDTKFSVIGGPAWMRSGTKSLEDLALAVRYRVSPADHPLALFAEVGGLVPLSSTVKGDQQSFGATRDNGSLKLNYQTHLAMVAELPHGQETRVIPEIGVGAALTSSKIEFTNGSSRHSEWGPYLVGGLRFWPKRQVSFLFQTSYSANPYAKSVQIASPAHTQTFNFPNSIWNVAATVQVKIGWTKAVLRAKE